MKEASMKIYQLNNILNSYKTESKSKLNLFKIFEAEEIKQLRAYSKDALYLAQEKIANDEMDELESEFESIEEDAEDASLTENPMSISTKRVSKPEEFEIPKEIAQKIFTLCMLKPKRPNKNIEQVLKRIHDILLSEAYKEENKKYIFPEEVLLNLFEYLSRKELIAFSQTCSEFRKIASDQRFFAKLPLDYGKIKENKFLHGVEFTNSLVLANGVCLFINEKTSTIYSVKSGKIIDSISYLASGSRLEHARKFHNCLLALNRNGIFEDKPEGVTSLAPNSIPFKSYPNGYFAYPNFKGIKVLSIFKGDGKAVSSEQEIISHAYSRDLKSAYITNNPAGKSLYLEDKKVADLGRKSDYFDIQFLDNNQLVIANMKNLYILDMNTLEKRAFVTSPGFNYYKPEASLDGKYLAVVRIAKDKSSEVQIFDASTMEAINTIRVDEEVKSLSFDCKDFLAITTTNSFSTIQFENKTFSPISRFT